MIRHESRPPKVCDSCGQMVARRLPEVEWRGLTVQLDPLTVSHLGEPFPVRLSPTGKQFLYALVAAKGGLVALEALDRLCGGEDPVNVRTVQTSWLRTALKKSGLPFRLPRMSGLRTGVIYLEYVRP